MNIEQRARVRGIVLVDGLSIRSVTSEEGLHQEALQKILSHSSPPGYRQEQRPGRMVDAHAEWIGQALDADREVPLKSRHSAKRIFDRLKAERGYEGGYSVVKALVVEIKVMKREVVVPPSHRPRGSAGGLRARPGQRGRDPEETPVLRDGPAL